MGCASSKRVDVALDVYRPAPSSFAVFDINSIEEPWRVANDTEFENPEKSTHVPALVLAKIDKLDSDGPQSWDEVSKALEDLKPNLNDPIVNPTVNPINVTKSTPPKPPLKTSSFHTLEELDAKLSPKPEKPEKPNKPVVVVDTFKPKVPHPVVNKSSSLKNNIFIMMDKQEREKEGKEPGPARWDPLSDYPELIPPGGSDTVVLYSTSLGGVRKTYEDCNRVRSILENHQVVFDERDVSLHGEFLSELRELIGEEGRVVPRLFVKGRYIGGAEVVVGLNDAGRLARLWSRVRVERGVGRQGCDGCGGARFVPCLDCGGSCKIVVGDEKERCSKCNENGLAHCPLCL
ncbi:uncharacterized protein At3g28850 [Impatiens glandulifera]|uniref:uncharacterized protein At3g28850 n=1 Tax=Impatiens glandulifera TaxID=253017 RepID=UPI001FB169FE|nr:uncharacterized protein At3g28850 [Impatiens glandulifera]